MAWPEGGGTARPLPWAPVHSCPPSCLSQTPVPSTAPRMAMMMPQPCRRSPLLPVPGTSLRGWHGGAGAVSHPQVRGAAAALSPGEPPRGGLGCGGGQGAGSESMGAAARPQTGSGRRDMKQPPLQGTSLCCPLRWELPLAKSPRSHKRPPGTAPGEHRLRRRWHQHPGDVRMPGPHHGSPWGHVLQGGGALSPRRGGPGHGGHLSLPRTAAQQQNGSRVPPASSAAGIIFYFTLNFSFFSIKTQNWLETQFQGWHLAPGYISHPSGTWGRGWTHRCVPGHGRDRGENGEEHRGIPGTGPGAFIWHRQTPTQLFPPTRVGKREREGPGLALPRPPADAGRTSSPVPPRVGQAQTPGGLPLAFRSTEGWARNGSGCCKDLS